MFNNIVKKVSSRKKKGKGEKYTGNEVLAILSAADHLTDPETGKTDRKELSILFDRTEYSLGYKIFERQTTIKGVTSCRSIMKYLYVNHKEKGSDMVTQEEFIRKLYAAFKFKAPESWVDLQKDVTDRVEAYQAILIKKDEAKAAAKLAAEVAVPGVIIAEGDAEVELEDEEGLDEVEEGEEAV